jgi:ParB-like chromosome segregation protein Spo0J
MAKKAKPAPAVAPEVSWPADKVVRWDIEALIPYANNAKVHSEAQVAQIAASITEWGWTVPVLVDESGELIAGHGRVLAARSLGLTSIPVMIAEGWTDEQKRAYRLADNKLAEGSEWDEDLLRIELGDLSAEGVDLTALAGFSQEEIDKLLAVTPEAAPPAEFPEFGEGVKTDHECPKCGYKWSGKAS